jgi:4-alpha-glucanotransferase
VRIIGDIPIFIAHQSAEVWARPDLFELDAAGHRTVVAGVPPDGFSATGQRWGNPLYRWSAHSADNYRWWIARIAGTCALVDLVRLDHFRGFESYWEIPASAPTAEQGRWVPAPGDALLQAVAEALGTLPIIAEDLGVITPEVDALRQRHGLPGMRVLQFAFGDDQDAGSRYLPHHHTADSVVYTGTHDNDTTEGWWHTLSDPTRQHVRDYLGADGQGMAWALIRAACASVADMAIYPMQDVLGLDGTHRMNQPGVGEGNWVWRFAWSQVGPEPAQRLHHLARLYDRLPRPPGESHAAA